MTNTAQIPTGQSAGRLRTVAGNYAIVWVTAALFLALAIATDGFLREANMRNILDQQSATLIAASVATLAMIAGGFDVSVSAVFVAAPLVALQVENATGSVFLALLAGIAFGLVCGAANGGIIAYGRVNSFIATLATSFMIFGIGFLVSDRSVLRPAGDGFQELARSRILGLTSGTWFAFAVTAAAWVVLAKTRYGRHLYATGGNAEAARLAGVPTTRIVASVFVLAGAAAGLAGTLNASRSISANPSDDFSFVFGVIAAIVVGGTSIAGGEGAVWRTVFGALFIAFMNNGFNLMQVDPIWQRIIQGIVILAAVGIDAWSRERR